MMPLVPGSDDLLTALPALPAWDPLAICDRPESTLSVMREHAQLLGSRAPCATAPDGSRRPQVLTQLDARASSLEAMQCVLDRLRVVATDTGAGSPATDAARALSADQFSRDRA